MGGPCPGADEGDSLAEAVRRACIQAAIAGYREAALSGLCHAGALEAALGAMEMLDLSGLVGPNNAGSTQDQGPARPGDATRP